MLPGGSGYFTCKQTWNWLLLNLSREGYMRSMWWQLGILRTISAFAFRHRETKKNLCRSGRSQDLPNTELKIKTKYWTLNFANQSSLRIFIIFNKKWWAKSIKYIIRVNKTGRAFSSHILLYCHVVLYPARTRWESILDVVPRGTELGTQIKTEGLSQWKIPMIPLGMEPATFRFVEQWPATN